MVPWGTSTLSPGDLGPKVDASKGRGEKGGSINIRTEMLHGWQCYPVSRKYVDRRLLVRRRETDIRPMRMKRVRGFISVKLKDRNEQPCFCVVSCRYVSIHEVWSL